MVEDTDSLIARRGFQRKVHFTEYVCVSSSSRDCHSKTVNDKTVTMPVKVHHQSNLDSLVKVASQTPSSAFSRARGSALRGRGSRSARGGLQSSRRVARRYSRGIDGVPTPVENKDDQMELFWQDVEKVSRDGMGLSRS